MKICRQTERQTNMEITKMMKTKMIISNNGNTKDTGNSLTTK